MHHLHSAFNFTLQPVVVVVFENFIRYAQRVQIGWKVKAWSSVKKTVSFIHHAAVVGDDKKHWHTETLADHEQIIGRDIDAATFHVYCRGSSAERSARSNRNTLGFIGDGNDHERGIFAHQRQDLT